MNGWTLLRSQVHLLQQKCPQQGATFSPWWAGPGVQLAYRMCARVGGWVVCAWLCARDWVCASPSKNACRDGEGKKNKCNTWREAKLMLKASGATFCLWTRLILPEKEDERGKNVLIYVSINWHWTMLWAGVKNQCIVIRCIQWLLGFFLQCVTFYDFFFFNFSF